MGCRGTVESRLFLIRSTSPAWPRSRKRTASLFPFSVASPVRGPTRPEDGFEYAHAKCLGVRALPVPRSWPSIRLSSLARDPAAINKGRRDAVGQSRCRAECIGFCQTGEWWGDNGRGEERRDEVGTRMGDDAAVLERGGTRRRTTRRTTRTTTGHWTGRGARYTHPLIRV